LEFADDGGEGVDPIAQFTINLRFHGAVVVEANTTDAAP
jgi:hypothetical protein